ncbi:MAG: aminodeoxychorismate synthase component I [Bacteroidetes bacterium]|jgi:para-aminobenzoate synthetase component 1|nr:aminodeoxychorismate synthase component I [Bacteroidota bacterium]
MIKIYGTAEAQDKMNSLGRKGIPFFFLISFDKSQNILLPLDECRAHGIQFRFPEVRRESKNTSTVSPKITNYQLPSEAEYRAAFDQVQYHLHRGDSYLLNLTAEVPVQVSGSLEEVYHAAGAKYNILLPDTFVCFSPERFIQIVNNTLSTHPMKGTLSAELPNAKKRLLEDPKEKAEHYTIVDLLRNDLSMVGRGTSVERFRYLTEIERKRGNLLQMSSHIQTGLAADWASRLGDIFFTLLPAGSITGAPKQKTVEIIQAVENHDRDFYTGVAGVFYEGKADSAILIRYMAHRNGQYYYKTGGGITTQSKWEDEYNEIREKIYIPLS